MAHRKLSHEALAAFHEVLLQAALRAERSQAARQADLRAKEIARRGDQRALAARELARATA